MWFQLEQACDDMTPQKEIYVEFSKKELNKTMKILD